MDNMENNRSDSPEENTEGAFASSQTPPTYSVKRSSMPVHSDTKKRLQDLVEKNRLLTKQLESSVHMISRLRNQRSYLLDMLVKKSISEYDDDDNTEDFSEEDIDSDIQSSDDEDVRAIKRRLVDNSYGPKSSPQIVQPPAKKTKRQSEKILFVRKDDHGNYVFPVYLGKITVLSLGTIQHKHFCNRSYIFPVGYTIQRNYKSMVNKDAFTEYICSIECETHEDGSTSPLFCIEAQDAPDIIIRKSNPTAAWSVVLKNANIIRGMDNKNTVSGPEYYALTINTVRKMIQELPGASECKNYNWVSFDGL